MSGIFLVAQSDFFVIPEAASSPKQTQLMTEERTLNSMFWGSVKTVK